MKKFGSDLKKNISKNEGTRPKAKYVEDSPYTEEILHFQSCMLFTNFQAKVLKNLICIM